MRALRSYGQDNLLIIIFYYKIIGNVFKKIIKSKIKVL